MANIRPNKVQSTRPLPLKSLLMTTPTITYMTKEKGRTKQRLLGLYQEGKRSERSKEKPLTAGLI